MKTLHDAPQFLIRATLRELRRLRDGGTPPFLYLGICASVAAACKNTTQDAGWSGEKSWDAGYTICSLTFVALGLDEEYPLREQENPDDSKWDGHNRVLRQRLCRDMIEHLEAYNEESVE